ncbi:MAG TPA: DUF2723 domain-containing protein, partial [Polyangiaceae bacterium]
MTAEMMRRRRAWLFWGVAGLAILAFVPRSYRTVALIGDSAELVTAAALWGVPHPPGYALFTLLGHIFARLPWFELPFRVHLTSAIFHAVAAGIVACTIDIVTGSLAGAIAGAAALILGRAFLLGSLYAEVFPLNDLFFAWLLFLGIRIAGGPKAAPSHGAAGPGTAVALGFSLAHHPMIVLGLPAVAILVGPSLAREVRARPGRAGGLAALALAIVATFCALLPIAASRDPLLS